MKEITLQYPVTLPDETISTLEMRRPKVRDQLVGDALEGSDAMKEATIFANLCEVELGVIQELDMVDYGALQQAYIGMVGKKQKGQLRSGGS